MPELLNALPNDLDIHDENSVFQKWQSSMGEEQERLQNLLIKLLTKHARSVCWQKLPDLQSEHSYISNESVYRAIARSKNFKGKSKFSTWFHKIVLNECNRVLKKQQARSEVPLEDTSEPSADGGNGGFDSVLATQVEDMARKQDRRILRMIKKGYSRKEIAAELHLSNANVRKIWERIVRRLRDAVDRKPSRKH